MSNQTTQNAPAQPTPCKMGCGFFGSNATGDCCSKCYKDLQQKKDDAGVQTTAQQAPPAAVEAAPAPMETSVVTEAKAAEASPMEVDEAPSAPAATEEKIEAAAAPAPLKAKKKKKKKGYKNLMADIAAGNASPRDDKKDDHIRKVTGGGAFTKIDRI